MHYPSPLSYPTTRDPNTIPHLHTSLFPQPFPSSLPLTYPLPPKKPLKASPPTPLLIPVSSSQLECNPTSNPVLASKIGAPLCPQYVQQSCISAPISELSC